jgi:hypothetical protein
MILSAEKEQCDASRRRLAAGSRLFEHVASQLRATWLLIYEVLDQGNHAARESGVATDPLMTNILADRFLGFVNCKR